VNARPPLDDRQTKEALLAENARLKERLLDRRSGSSMWPVIGGLAAHILLRPLMDPWLNASSDAKVYAAVAVLGVPVIFALVMLVRALTRKSD
jgi:hypothetical protein